MADKSIIDVKDEWSFIHRFIANLINTFPVFIWVFISFFLLYQFNIDPESVDLRDSMLNIVVPSAVYGILTLVSGLTLVSWFFPFFSYRRLMREGSPIERLGCLFFWGLVSIALSIIIGSAIK
jgi:hypothetical protein